MIKDIEKRYNLIKECKIRRLTTQESLDYIKRNGIELSERTYRRYKKEWEDKIQERILAEGERGQESEYLQRWDTIKQVEKEYWNLFSKSENEILKGRLLHFILDLQDKSKECLVSLNWSSERIKKKKFDELGPIQAYRESHGLGKITAEGNPKESKADTLFN